MGNFTLTDSDSAALEKIENFQIQGDSKFNFRVRYRF